VLGEIEEDGRRSCSIRALTANVEEPGSPAGRAGGKKLADPVAEEKCRTRRL